MRNKITAVLAFALVLFAPTFVPSPAQAAGTGAGDIVAVHANGVIDCNPGGVSWPDWTDLGNPSRGAGRICGNPNVSPPSPVRTWDKQSDGKCISMWFQINQGASVYEITPARACGINIIKSGWTPSYPVWAVYVGYGNNGATFGQLDGWIELY